jgi:hypothetical protein
MRLTAGEVKGAIGSTTFEQVRSLEEALAINLAAYVLATKKKTGNRP